MALNNTTAAPAATLSQSELFRRSSMADLANMPRVKTIVDGLEHRITVYGFLYAIAQIQSLPDDRQEVGYMKRMCRIVREIGGDDLAWMIWGVGHHVGRDPDLWPAHGGSEPDGTYSNSEIGQMEGILDKIAEYKDGYRAGPMLESAPPSDVVKFI